MSDLNQQPEKDSVGADSAAKPVRSVASVSRRRLIRGGAAAVPVVATLASRPALAWDCQSPSAWGSEQLNPNTSLKTNAGHNRYKDETWTISNWKSNNARSATGVSAKPWDYLASKCPGIVNSATATWDSSKGQWKNFNYANVTFAHLANSIPGFYLAGFNSASKVCGSLSTSSSSSNQAGYFVIAQLNYLLLKNIASPNDLDRCLRDGEISAMVKGAYPSSGATAWSSDKVWLYLHNNWIVRGS